MSKIVYWVKDLLFSSKIREAAKTAGVEVESVRDAPSLLLSARSARMVILDLRAPDALEALQLLSQDDEAKKVPKVGFIDHEKIDVMRAAEELGCKPMAKGRFAQELPAMLQQLVG